LRRPKIVPLLLGYAAQMNSATTAANNSFPWRRQKHSFGR
jgi:hypothetical protein